MTEDAGETVEFRRENAQIYIRFTIYKITKYCYIDISYTYTYIICQINIIFS